MVDFLGVIFLSRSFNTVSGVRSCLELFYKYSVSENRRLLFSVSFVISDLFLIVILRPLSILSKEVEC